MQVLLFRLTNTALLLIAQCKKVIPNYYDSSWYVFKASIITTAICAGKNLLSITADKHLDESLFTVSYNAFIPAILKRKNAALNVEIYLFCGCLWSRGPFQASWLKRLLFLLWSINIQYIIYNIYCILYVHMVYTTCMALSNNNIKYL